MVKQRDRDGQERKAREKTGMISPDRAGSEVHETGMISPDRAGSEVHESGVSCMDRTSNGGESRT